MYNVKLLSADTSMWAKWNLNQLYITTATELTCYDSSSKQHPWVLCKAVCHSNIGLADRIRIFDHNRTPAIALHHQFRLQKLPTTIQTTKDISYKQYKHTHSAKCGRTKYKCACAWSHIDKLVFAPLSNTCAPASSFYCRPRHYWTWAIRRQHIPRGQCTGQCPGAFW